MALSVYVDGSGPPDPGFGYLVRETGESYYERRPGITSNQAEYLAVISALTKFARYEGVLTIYSDSKNTVFQLNHEFAINSIPLQRLAMQAWPLISAIPHLKIEWIPRERNIAGKMLGS